MRNKALAAAFGLALLAQGCATAPVSAVSEQSLAEDVFRLSGGLDDFKIALRLAPMALSERDVVGQCREGLGRDGGGLMGRAACEMIAQAFRSLRSGEGAMNRALEAQFAAMEKQAVQALVDTYSQQELAAMQRYYASPEGRSIVAKRNEYLARLFGLS